MFGLGGPCASRMAFEMSLRYEKGFPCRIPKAEGARRWRMLSSGGVLAVAIMGLVDSSEQLRAKRGC